MNNVESADIKIDCNAGVNIIKKYFPNISTRQEKQLLDLGELYPSWNQKINVISRKDIQNLYIHHILHSLAIAKFLVDPRSGTRFMDLGTGGGFPGIPLAIILPDCHFHLIDRIRKKISVAQSIADAIGLKNVTFQHGDSGECHEKFDFVISRAVMEVEPLVNIAKKNVSKKSDNRYKNGLICLKGGNLENELAETKFPFIDEPLSVFFNEPFFQTKCLIYVPL